MPDEVVEAVRGHYLKRNVQRMVESCRAFLDLGRVESHPTSEYRLQENGWGTGA